MEKCECNFVCKCKYYSLFLIPLFLYLVCSVSGFFSQYVAFQYWISNVFNMSVVIITISLMGLHISNIVGCCISQCVKCNKAGSFVRSFVNIAVAFAVVLSVVSVISIGV